MHFFWGVCAFLKSPNYLEIRFELGSQFWVLQRTRSSSLVLELPREFAGAAKKGHFLLKIREIWAEKVQVMELPGGTKTREAAAALSTRVSVSPRLSPSRPRAFEQ